MKKLFATIFIALALSILNVESRQLYKSPPPIIYRMNSFPRFNLLKEFGEPVEINLFFPNPN
ncbi:MAG: hypothetical protein N2517_05630 [Ignavibacteria bacterium]|nr:hypothetical protein [Ignavibacteria bacterium]